MLKLFLCLTLILFGTKGQQWQQQWNQIVQSCKTLKGASDADAASLRPFSPPGSYNASCILACVKKSMKLMNADNTININLAMEKIQPLRIARPDIYTKLGQALNSCRFPPQSDECLAVQRFSNCLEQQKSQLGIKL